MQENERENNELEPAKDGQSEKAQPQNERRRLFQLLAGGYLVYLAYQLISGVLAEKTLGTGEAACLAAAVLFAGFGIWLLLRNLKAEFKKNKAEKHEDEGGREQ